MKGKLEEIDRGGSPSARKRESDRHVPGEAVRGKAQRHFATGRTVLRRVAANPQLSRAGEFKDTDKACARMNGRLDIVVERIPDAISIPASALFPRQGRPTVYVPDQSGWRPQEVQVLARNPDEVAIAHRRRHASRVGRARDEDGEAMTVSRLSACFWALASLPWAPGEAPDSIAPPTPRPHPSFPSRWSTRQRDLRGLRSRRLQGGNSKMLTAPMVGGSGLVLTSLRRQGELVKAGDVVAEFDTTEQNFKLREAEADLAEPIKK